MKKAHKISYKNLPLRSPFNFFIILFLIFDKFNVQEWVWGAAGIFCFIVLVVYIVDKFNTVSVDIFKEANEPKSSSKISRFEQRIAQMEKQRNGV